MNIREVRGWAERGVGRGEGGEGEERGEREGGGVGCENGNKVGGRLGGGGWRRWVSKRREEPRHGDGWLGGGGGEK